MYGLHPLQRCGQDTDGPGAPLESWSGPGGWTSGSISMSWAAVEASADTLSQQVLLGETDAPSQFRASSAADAAEAVCASARKGSIRPSGMIRYTVCSRRKAPTAFEPNAAAASKVPPIR
jgi:hypothetical protein